MAKTNCQRTFTACWTCRRRNVRCDNATPSCSQCLRMKVQCEGYQIRLVWVDSKTGHYVPQQRRAYPCELTWRGYPSLSLAEVSHLIDDCENRVCKCELHSGPSPFHVFPQGKESIEKKREKERMISKSPPATPASPSSLPLDVAEFESPAFTEDSLSNYGSLMVDGTPRSDGLLPLFDDVYFSEGTDGYVDEDDAAQNRCQEVVRRKTDFAHIFMERRAQSPSFTLSPSQSPTPSANPHEDWLFHHYVTHVSLLMIPIDDGRNPWKSTYPSIAIQATSSYSARSLYHAILAQSAFNLANLKGNHRGVDEKAHGMRYLGLALRDLRQSLVTPTENYSSVLAALLTVTIVEHVFNGKSRGWRYHFKGAMGFVIQYLRQQPWRLSRDAWVITQNFALSNVIAQTVGKCSVVQSNTGDNRDAVAVDNIAEICEVMSEVMKRSSFGYTIGGTTRLIKSIYQIRLLEEQMSCRGYKDAHDIEGNEDMTTQVHEIVQQLQAPIDEEVRVYCDQQEPGNIDILVLPRTRTLATLHLQLFNSAVMIYLLRVVLRYPPSAVSKYVWEVLNDTIAFIDLYGGSVSLWPVFVAAAEAYTLESKALTERFFEFSETLGMTNRTEVQRVIRQVWAEREKLSATQGCDAGEIIVDWREVMAQLDLDILLL